ncbi:MAG: carbon-nitrogen hydrolase family protein [Marinosulfonomonas sp.]|nr:carbon-nitrogen hydrolase family protein [Marinosulfonomonas sp.]
MKAALIQLNSSDQPADNIPQIIEYMRQATGSGAGFLLTPEVTNCVSDSRVHQQSVLRHEGDDPTLAALQSEAKALGVWLLIGSLALKTSDADGRFANRSFMISPTGTIVARYDKIHMFDVEISKAETYRESAGYRPGKQAVIADTGFAKVGMTICYDVRFPHLHRTLAQNGAQILTCPAAFSPVSGAAHWETLLRARAIETGCYVFAPAQCGPHPATTGRSRDTYGHSLAVSPWGKVIADGGTKAGLTLVDFDLSEVDAARRKIPSLSYNRDYGVPE